MKKLSVISVFNETQEIPIIDFSTIMQNNWRINRKETFISKLNYIALHSLFTHFLNYCQNEVLLTV